MCAGGSGVWERTSQAGPESQLLMEAGFTGRSGEPSAQGTRHPHWDTLGVRHGGGHTTGLIPHLLENHVGRKAVPGKGRRETGCKGRLALPSWRASWPAWPCWLLPLGARPPLRATHSAFRLPDSILPGSQDPGNPDKASAPLHFLPWRLSMLGSPEGTRFHCSHSGGRMVATSEFPDSGGWTVTYMA